MSLLASCGIYPPILTAGIASAARLNIPFSKLRLKEPAMPRSFSLLLLVVTLGLAPVVLRADDPKPDAKAIDLFNGKDLTGWGYKSGEKFDGKTESDDGRFSAKDGILTVNPGKGIKQLWTTRKFPNDFELRLEFRAAVNADSGLFLREPQLQVRDYLVAGPYKDLKKYKPQDWNEIVVVVKGTVARCTCNGEVLEEAMKVPATGGIGLEADRGQMEYRNIRLKETKDTEGNLVSVEASARREKVPRRAELRRSPNNVRAAAKACDAAGARPELSTDPRARRAEDSERAVPCGFEERYWSRNWQGRRSLAAADSSAPANGEG